MAVRFARARWRGGVKAFIAEQGHEGERKGSRCSTATRGGKEGGEQLAQSQWVRLLASGGSRAWASYGELLGNIEKPRGFLLSCAALAGRRSRIVTSTVALGAVAEPSRGGDMAVACAVLQGRARGCDAVSR